MLNRLALSMVGDLDAEDCAQEAFVIAWRKLPGLRAPEAMVAWLIRITVRLCIRRSRYCRLLRPLSALRFHPEFPEQDPSAVIDVEWMLMKLAPRQRAVMHLTVIEGMSDSEIAVALHITAASVRSHRRRAKEALQKWIAVPVLTPKGELYEPE